MVEIIASISRIITEDNKPAEASRPVAPEKSDVLALTDVVNEDGSVSRLDPGAGDPGRVVAGSEEEVRPATGQTTGVVGSEALQTQGRMQTKPEQGRERFLSSGKQENVLQFLSRR